MRSLMFAIAVFIPALVTVSTAQSISFVKERCGRLYVDNKPYYFVGANYWYGSLLGIEKDRQHGLQRLRLELDLLKKNGVTNLRLMAGAEGTGILNGVMRVGPPIQPRQGEFDETVLRGLDLVLSEMGRRNMKAVIYLSNNWEWSGGFQQYLLWNHAIGDEFIAKKPDWDELRDTVAKFYTCEPCMNDYRRQVHFIVGRTNTFNRKRYAEDPAIMAWEMANEPRPMRPAANEAYVAFLRSASAAIKIDDPNHLVTTGHEGWIGTESVSLFENVHSDPNIDYVTIHIWPKNWGWFENGKLDEGFSGAVERSVEYVNSNVPTAEKLGKPIVIEEFGLPRDGQSLEISSTTQRRDEFYKRILSFVGDKNIAGANFWAFAGFARPVRGQSFWKSGDDRTGDPPMEEQGLNSVFDSDLSTLAVVRSEGRRAKELSKRRLASLAGPACSSSQKTKIRGSESIVPYRTRARNAALNTM
ncbi:MAG: cellulase family glycosylhydrolase [Acidobacteriota bacterium]